MQTLTSIRRSIDPWQTKKLVLQTDMLWRSSNQSAASLDQNQYEAIKSHDHL